jgi:hypothetical protein
MSDGTPVADIIELAQRDCRRKRTQCRDQIDSLVGQINDALAKIDERLDRKHDQLLIHLGKHGNNGKFGDACARIDALEAADKERTKAKLSLATKIIGGAIGATTIGGGGAYAIIRLLLGG